MSFPFSISCCSLALRDQPVAVAVRQIAEAGFAGIEMWWPHIEKLSLSQWAEVAESCAGQGLEIPVISPYFSFTRGRESWEQSLKTAERVIVAAEIAGVKKIRTFIDCGPNSVPSEGADAGQWRAAVEGLRALCALDSSKLFVLETHQATLANTLASTHRILDEVAMPNLRLNYQVTTDFLQKGYLDCLAALYPSVDHMHWQQVTADGAGTYLEEPGQIDFKALFRFLTERDYRGTAAVEYCWTPVGPGRIASAAKLLRDMESVMESKAGA